MQSDTEQLFLNGDAFFNAILPEISNAQKRIDIETYIFENDAFGLKILLLLKEAAQRGVKVRLLVDAFGSQPNLSWLIQQTRDSGIQLRIYRHWSRAKFIYFFSFMNQRNHRKTFIFDQKTAYVGSMNIASYHLSEYSNQNAWKDLGIGFTFKEQVALVLSAFEKSFAKITFFKTLFLMRVIFPRHKKPALPIRLNNTFESRWNNHRDFLERIAHAQHSVWIANAYFLPEKGIIKALCTAGERGVDVRILISKQSDLIASPWVAALFYPRMLKANIKIYEYFPNVFHGKACIIDDWSMVGTSNLTHRSLFHNLEIDVEIQNQENKNLLRVEFVELFTNSLRITKADKKLPWYKKVVAHFLLLFKHWL